MYAEVFIFRGHSLTGRAVMEGGDRGDVILDASFILIV